MWWVIIFTALLHILTVECRSTSIDLEQINPLWMRNDNNDDDDDEGINGVPTFPYKNLEEVFREQRQFQRNEDSNDYDLLVPKLRYDKRALAMMARWGPFSGIGKQRAPIRSASGYLDPSESNINTQTRGRMVGQPLRWG